MARLFFALWPDKTARAALARRAAEIVKLSGGRPVPAANLHLTLAFLGEVDPARLGALQRAAAGLSAAAFDVVLDVVGEFRSARVAWAGSSQPSKELLALQSALEERIRVAGFVPDERAFVAHLTLARRVREALAVQAVEPVSWRAASFALVESGRGDGAYHTVAEWKLGEGED